MSSNNKALNQPFVKPEPVVVKITGLGHDVKVESNADNPKMVMMALLMALQVMINQHEVKKPSVIQPASFIPSVPGVN